MLFIVILNHFGVPLHCFSRSFTKSIDSTFIKLTHLLFKSYASRSSSPLLEAAPPSPTFQLCTLSLPIFDPLEFGVSGNPHDPNEPCESRDPRDPPDPLDPLTRHSLVLLQSALE